MKRIPFGFLAEDLGGGGTAGGADDFKGPYKLKLLKKEGDIVAKGDVIGVVEIEKATVEIAAPFSGMVVALEFKDGDEWNYSGKRRSFPFGTIIDPHVGSIDTEEVVEGLAEGNTEVALPELHSGHAQGVQTVSSVPSQSGGFFSPPSADGTRIRATPEARQRARKEGVSLEHVIGTGPSGVIQAGDIRSLERRESAPRRPESWVGDEVADYSREETIETSERRKEIARMMEASARIPAFGDMLTDVDVTVLVEFRERYKAFFKNVLGSALRYDHVILFLAVRLLSTPRFSALNGYWEEASEEVRHLIHVNAGIAVQAVRADGTPDDLVVPVVHGAEKLSFLDFIFVVEEKIRRTETRRLGRDDIRNLSFTFNNTGRLGGDAPASAIPATRTSTGAIRPTSMILNMTRIRKGDLGRFYTNLAFRFDHRLCDGSLPTAFVSALKDFLEAQKRPDDFLKLFNVDFAM
ncbi:MAG: 2-oxo acid dehydrogenase subunit E2 [Patescibacteria group bacterium]